MSANLGNVGKALSGEKHVSALAIVEGNTLGSDDFSRILKGFEKHVSALAIVEGNTLGSDDFSRILKGFELFKTPLEGATSLPEPGSGGITLPTFGQIFPSPLGRVW